MRSSRIRTALCSTIVLTAASVIAAPAVAQQPYDGLWNVTIITKTGTCAAQSNYPLTVSEGKISAAGADVNGHVGSGGMVKVSIGPAYANGQLSGNSGSGRWNGASG